jgi:hypothetical protein
VFDYIFNAIFHAILVIRNHRILVVIGIATCLFAILTLYFAPFLFYFSHIMGYSEPSSSIPITFFLVSLASFALMYLQSGSKDRFRYYSESRLSERYVREIESNKAKILELTKEISDLKEIQNEIGRKFINDEERDSLIQEIVKETGENTIKKIFDERISILKDDLEKKSSFDRILNASEDIVNRLKIEISNLSLRSNINLVLGMSITLSGLYLLWSTVTIVDASDLLKQLASGGEDSNFKFFKNLMLPLVPRLLLVLFVEIFAYFFLRLYKDGLSEIKYFQNELTNVESKLVAVEFSYITGLQDSIKEAISMLSKTERNYILEKGQTTVELERAKSESDLTKNIIKTIPELLKKSEKK